MVKTGTISFRTRGNADIHDITDQVQAEVHLDDPCVQDAMHHVPDEYSRCNPARQPVEPVYEGGGSACPSGCTNHPQGCDIKGNISFDSGEKVYHVPGGAFYTSTVINPAYGERWFCTEAEAQANGFRRSYK